MKVTVRELFDLGLWERYCQETGTNEWAVNEGLIGYGEEVEWKVKSRFENIGGGHDNL